MLVRNLRKQGDYERAILSQEENLRMAIANDRNVAQARSQFSKGMIPELTPQQQKSKEEILTDAIAIAAKAQENLLTLYPKETVQQFMAGLTQESMTYLNVYWNELKPILKNKTGLNKTFFDRILKTHIQGIVDSRGMSTVPSNGIKSTALNELAEVKRLGFSWMINSPVVQAVYNKLVNIAGRNNPVTQRLETFMRFLPTEKILEKANTLPEVSRARWFNELVNLFQGTDNKESNWETLYVKEGQDFYNSALKHGFPDLDRASQGAIKQLYAFDGF
jgi:hypothetical protein